MEEKDDDNDVCERQEKLYNRNMMIIHSFRFIKKRRNLPIISYI